MPILGHSHVMRISFLSKSMFKAIQVNQLNQQFLMFHGGSEASLGSVVFLPCDSHIKLYNYLWSWHLQVAFHTNKRFFQSINLDS